MSPRAQKGDGIYPTRTRPEVPDGVSSIEVRRRSVLCDSLRPTAIQNMYTQRVYIKLVEVEVCQMEVEVHAVEVEVAS